MRAKLEVVWGVVCMNIKRESASERRRKREQKEKSYAHRTYYLYRASPPIHLSTLQLPQPPSLLSFSFNISRLALCPGTQHLPFFRGLLRARANKAWKRACVKERGTRHRNFYFREAQKKENAKLEGRNDRYGVEIQSPSHAPLLFSLSYRITFFFARVCGRDWARTRAKDACALHFAWHGQLKVRYFFPPSLIFIIICFSLLFFPMPTCGLSQDGRFDPFSFSPCR